MDRIAYLAGLFDGEGCIVISRYKRNDRANDKDYYCIRIKVTNKNTQVLNLFKDIFNCGCIYQDKRSSVWEWSLTSSERIKGILRELLPLLIVRRKQAIEALTFNGDDSQECEKLKERIHKLNTV